MLLLQQARLMQSKIPRPLEYKVTSIGDKIQRRGIARVSRKQRPQTTDLENANLENTDLENTDLENTDLENTDLPI